MESGREDETKDDVEMTADERIGRSGWLAVKAGGGWEDMVWVVGGGQAMKTKCTGNRYES